MADEDELFLANLDEFVNDEEKIVTYKWLSRTLSVPVNRAKQMLYAFVQKQKTLESASHLDITYVIGGRYLMDGDMVHRYVITRDEDLTETKKTFSVVTSLHIYSVQKCKLKDSNALYTVDYNIQQECNSKDNRWSHIHCPSAQRLADNGAHRGKAASHKVNEVTQEDKKCSTTKMMNGDHGSSLTSKGPTTLGTEQKSKVSDTKPKKGQMSALEMFAAKPSTSKTEKKSNKKEEDTQQDKEKQKAAETKSDSNKAGSRKSFFGQNTTVKNVSKKSGTTEGEQGATAPKEGETLIPAKKKEIVGSSSNNKREFSSEDEEAPLPSKLSKAVKSDTKENKVSKEEKKKVQKKDEDKKAEKTKSSKAAKKKAVISESDEEPDEKPKKRRKRTKQLPKEDSSDEEETEKNTESDKKVSSDKGSTRSHSPLPQQQARQTEQETGRRRKRKRELKSKTYMNDEGFMVTEKVWESESTDASDDDVQITAEPQVKDKHSSPAKKTNKKTQADMKNKAAKQASLTSFFKKS